MKPKAQRQIPPAAINSQTGKPYAAARIKHPTIPGMYYRHGAEPPWVKMGWTHWSLASWLGSFGSAYAEGDARNWDFFGEPIELWPPGEVGYSDE